jgi:hypothetical protein
MFLSLPIVWQMSNGYPSFKKKKVAPLRTPLKDFSADPVDLQISDPPTKSTVDAMHLRV